MPRNTPEVYVGSANTSVFMPRNSEEVYVGSDKSQLVYA